MIDVIQNQSDEHCWIWDSVKESRKRVLVWLNNDLKFNDKE